MTRAAAFAAALVALLAPPLGAQPITTRGFVEARGFWFPREAPPDDQHVILDVLARADAFARPAPWLQIQGGADLRANTGDQVSGSWRPDLADRGVERPILSVRRLAATLTRGRLTIDAGKQFIRWGKTDIVTPTDRFAPRDYLNVVDAELLAVRGVRGVAQLADHAIDVVWLPAFTPSRLPLAGKRWTVVPADAPAIESLERRLPDGQQAGVRWAYTGSAFEVSAAYFDGYNHLPIVDLVAPLAFEIRFPEIRMYGVDAAIPSRWITVRAEAAYFESRDSRADDYVLYVLQLERQQGEWLILGGYAGEHVAATRSLAGFAPDRGMTRALVGRASYTIDPLQTAAVETAVRENLDGVYLKGEYSRAYGSRWRATIAAAWLAGEPGDFLGQYERNSHAILGVRYSF